MKNGAARRLAPKCALPYPQPPFRSTLALRTIEGRTAALDDAPDRPAAGARTALAVVDREMLGEIAKLAVRADKVLQSRPARGNGLIEDVMDRLHQALQAFERD